MGSLYARDAVQTELSWYKQHVWIDLSEQQIRRRQWTDLSFGISAINKDPCTFNLQSGISRSWTGGHQVK
jgi:hypothetical protein